MPLYNPASGGGGSGIAATIVDAKGDLIAATAADTVARKAAGTNGRALHADSSQTDGLAWAVSTGFYRTIFTATGAATTSAASGSKYVMRGATDATNYGTSSTNVALYSLTAADIAGPTGLTTMLRLQAIIKTAVAPAVDVVVGLYPVTTGATDTAGTVIAASALTFTAPAANSDVVGATADFALPADGTYLLGYTVSGTPSAAFVITGNLQTHHT